MLTPQHQQLMLAQQNMTSPSAANDESRDTDRLTKLKMAQLQQQQNSNPQQQQQQQQQQLQQHALSNQQSQNSNLNPHQQDKMGGAGSITMDGSMSNSFRGNDPVCPFMVIYYELFLGQLTQACIAYQTYNLVE
ncbi:hypothetical protein ACFX1W_016977 [Malus domestica]